MVLGCQAVWDDLCCKVWLARASRAVCWEPLGGGHAKDSDVALRIMRLCVCRLLMRWGVSHWHVRGTNTSWAQDTLRETPKHSGGSLPDPMACTSRQTGHLWNKGWKSPLLLVWMWLLINHHIIFFLLLFKPARIPTLWTQQGFCKQQSDCFQFPV